MGKYVVVLSETDKSVFNEGLVKRHVEHLRKLSNEKIIELCGPLKDVNKALWIVNADSIDDVVKYIKQDPFISEGFYLKYDIDELIEANEDNNFLS